MVSQKTLLDMFSWMLNICSSVGLIFINKILMGPKGYSFKYATSLTALHFFCSAGYASAMGHLGYITPSKKRMPVQDFLVYLVYGAMAVICPNLSLLTNPVSFYQLMKLANIPFVSFVERIFFGKIFTWKILSSCGLVVVGVAMVTVSELQLQTGLGLFMAALQVIGVSMQQIQCSRLQKKYEMSSMELMVQTMWWLGSATVVVGPFLDQYVTAEWVLDYQYGRGAVLMIIASCVTAIFVNVSSFMCLGRFSALTFQTLGHLKTIAVFLGAWLFLGEEMTYKVVLGLGTAVLGMIGYGYFTYQLKQQQNSHTKTNKDIGSEQEPMIPQGKGESP